jgi:uncharacterized protein
MLTPSLIQQITKSYRLPLGGVHGLPHWARVLVNARRLAIETGADATVIELFAVFHDARRQNEGYDPEHGSRAASLAHALLSGNDRLSREKLQMLDEACRFHTDGLRDADVTVQTCWDADRLDLLRVGTYPEAELLCTEAAREPAVIAWANERARKGDVPRLIWEEWGMRLPEIGAAD